MLFLSSAKMERKFSVVIKANSLLLGRNLHTLRISFTRLATRHPVQHGARDVLVQPNILPSTSLHGARFLRLLGFLCVRTSSTSMLSFIIFFADFLDGFPTQHPLFPLVCFVPWLSHISFDPLWLPSPHVFFSSRSCLFFRPSGLPLFLVSLPSFGLTLLSVLS